MAYTSREIAAPAAHVFAVVSDPRTFPRWLAGASDIRGVDDDWPRVGSRFHHRVGIGPLTLADSSEVLEIVPDRLLRLSVRARPLVSAVVTFTVVGDDVRSVVSFEEEPGPRAIGNLVRPVMDPITHVRNHISLERLEKVVVGHAGAAEATSG